MGEKCTGNRAEVLISSSLPVPRWGDVSLDFPSPVPQISSVYVEISAGEWVSHQRAP